MYTFTANHALSPRCHLDSIPCPWRGIGKFLLTQFQNYVKSLVILNFTKGALRKQYNSCSQNLLRAQ